MKYLSKHWKTIAAMVYILICILDFIVIPVYMMYVDSNFVSELVELHALLKDQPELLKIAMGNPFNWMPFTLRGAGLFHLSFGAILTGSIIGKRKKQDE